MINSLKSFLIVEFDSSLIDKKQIVEYSYKIKEYVELEIGIIKHSIYKDESLVVLVIPSNKINVYMINSLYDYIEQFEDTLNKRYDNIKEFIKSLIDYE